MKPVLATNEPPPTNPVASSISEHYKLPDTRFGLAEGPHQSGLIVAMQHPCACNQAPNPEQLGEKAKRQAVTHPPKLAAAFR
jgi:hypothetical protein